MIFEQSFITIFLLFSLYGRVRGEECYNYYYNEYYSCDYGCCGRTYDSNYGCCSLIRSIIGLVFGGLFFFGIIIFGICFCVYAMKKKKAQRVGTVQPTTVAVVNAPPPYQPSPGHSTNTYHNQQYMGGPAPPPYPGPSAHYGQPQQQNPPLQQKGGMNFGDPSYPPPDY